ncbi:YheT family hydrolase [Roseimaritima ulvae]|nr:alpha/beta fold hydrolase [Roseimaritima ulvae]
MLRTIAIPRDGINHRMPQPSGSFQPPWWMRGGHRQTIYAAIRPAPKLPYRATPIPVQTRDGDWLVLHDDAPPAWQPGQPAMLLLHGLCGCHAASYMVRLAARMNAEGIRTFRLDMRGCGAAAERSHSLTHAGRSDDVLDALDEVARLTESRQTESQQTASSPIFAVGVSLGGNQLLRAVGRVDAGEDSHGCAGIQRLQRIAAIAPPIDLAHCSKNMQRRLLRLYNWYFIRALLQRVPANVQASEAFQQLQLRRQPRPRTLRELDRLVTAPLGGFAGVDDYYTRASSAPYLNALARPTLILTSADDPIVPIETFRQTSMSTAVELSITRRGGHAGFVGRGQEEWVDDQLVEWFCGQVVQPVAAGAGAGRRG